MRAIILSHAYADPSKRGKAIALARMGHAMALAVPAAWPPPEGGAAARIPHSDDGRIRVVPLRVTGELGDPVGVRWHRRSLSRLFTEFRPDLVQVEEEPGTPAAAVASAAAHRLGVPVVLYAREGLVRQRSFGEGLRWRRTLARAAGIASPTTGALAVAQRHARSVPGVVLPQFGINAPVEVTREAHDGFVIGFVGRLVPERGLDLLFRACVRLLGPWRVVVAGSGPAQHALEELAERLGIAARVTWLGAIRPELLSPRWAGFDTVVIPPRSTPDWVESTGAAALEAMARGIAVIATRSGILPELLGEAGVVVGEEDPEALATSIQELIDEPARREALALSGRRRVLAEFTDEAVARRTGEFWAEVRAKRSSG